MSARPTRSSGQLALELPLDLPAIPVAPEWKDQQRLWGHAFHPMCSYLASFPAALTHAFIARYSRPGDVVLDRSPGVGRPRCRPARKAGSAWATTSTRSPHLLTAAKVEPPTRAAGGDPPGDAAAGLARDERGVAGPGRRACPPTRSPRARSCRQPDPGSGRRRAARPCPWRWPWPSIHGRWGSCCTFARGCGVDDRTDRFLAAAITGILHGKSASYLSELMPNTFSMAPRYVRDFAQRTGFASPDRDVFDGLSKKLDRLYRGAPPSMEGVALLGDARDVTERAQAALRARGRSDQARLVITSPPYLRVVKYGYYNWLRTWFLGFDAREIDATLDDAHHREPYLAFLRDVLAGLRPILTDDAVVVLVIGDVETDRGRSIKGGVGLAERAWEAAAEPEGYRLAGVALDDVAASRKMTKLWGDEAGRATKTDRILVLGATETGRRRALAGASLDVDWTWPPRALRAL